MDNKPKPGPKGPRGKRSIGALARRAQRPAYIRHTGLAQIAKAQTELDERKAKVVTLEAMVVRQSTTFRAEAVKLREVRAEVIAARATQSHAPCRHRVWTASVCTASNGCHHHPLSALGRWVRRRCSA